MTKNKADNCSDHCCCCDDHCSEDKINEINKKTVKPLKVRFCPRCKSTDVGFVFRLQTLFGLLPKVECKKCGYQNIDFPLLVISKEDLNKKVTLRKKDKKNKLVQKVKK